MHLHPIRTQVCQREDDYLNQCVQPAATLTSREGEVVVAEETTDLFSSVLVVQALAQEVRSLGS